MIRSLKFLNGSHSDTSTPTLTDWESNRSSLNVPAMSLKYRYDYSLAPQLFSSCLNLLSRVNSWRSSRQDRPLLRFVPLRETSSLSPRYGIVFIVHVRQGLITSERWVPAALSWACTYTVYTHRVIAGISSCRRPTHCIEAPQAPTCGYRPRLGQTLRLLGGYCTTVSVLCTARRHKSGLGRFWRFARNRACLGKYFARASVVLHSECLFSIV